MSTHEKRTIEKPIPPPETLGWAPAFIPAPEVNEWVYEHIIRPTGVIHNPDHLHLQEAHIGFLWTNVENSSKGRRIIGQAEQPAFRCGKWQKARQELQMEQWFGALPDFIITLDTTYCRLCTDTEFCALVEHELFHCAQAMDEFEQPRFNKDTGLPVFTMKGHDVEEFIGVVRRYGVGQPDGALAQMVQAANRGPEVARVDIAKACGTCLVKAGA
jgi:hypothetical protein